MLIRCFYGIISDNSYNKQDDKDYVECRMKDMGVKVNIHEIEGLGQFSREKETKGQYRLIKINL